MVNQAKALLVTAEHDLRATLPAAHAPGGKATKTDTKMLMRALAELDPADATRLALRILAQRWLFLAEQITDADVRIRSLVRTTAPQLLSRPGIGIHCAARLLITAGDNPDRLSQRRRLRRALRRQPRRGQQRSATADTGSTAAATAPPTAPYGSSPTSGSSTTPAPASSPNDAA